MELGGARGEDSPVSALLPLLSFAGSYPYILGLQFPEVHSTPLLHSTLLLRTIPSRRVDVRDLSTGLRSFTCSLFFLTQVEEA